MPCPWLTSATRALWRPGFFACGLTEAGPTGPAAGSPRTASGYLAGHHASADLSSLSPLSSLTATFGAQGAALIAHDIQQIPQTRFIGSCRITGRYRFASVEVHSLGDAFRLVMDRNRWSGARLARELGTSQPWVSMVLNGRRDPGLRRSAELLARTGWELQLVPTGEDAVKRREFLTAAATVASVPSRSAGPYSNPDYLNSLTARLSHNEAQIGGAPLARAALRHVQRLTPAKRGKDASLRAAASRLCRQAALILHDVRHLGRAEQVATTALGFARGAQDLAAQAQAYDTLSLISAHLPDGRGAEYARRGLAVHDTDDGDRAVLSARLARSLALMPGQGYQARATLDQALELSGPSWRTSSEVAGNAGIAFTDLGMPGRAEQHLAAAVDLTAASPFLHSLYLARQAKTAIRAQQPDTAAQAMLTLAAVAPLVDSPRLRIHLRHIVDGTQRWRAIPSVRHAQEALKEAVT